MKLIALFLALFVTCSLTSAQSIEDLVGTGINSFAAKSVKDKLKGATAKYNKEQPGYVFANKRISVRLPEDGDDEFSRWLVGDISRALTALRAKPVFGFKELKDESENLRELRSDDEIDQKSLPKKGKLKGWDTILEVSFVEFEESKDMSAFFGRWLKNISGDLSTETSYFGLIVTVRQATGEAIAIYKTMGVASSHDNVAADLSSFFGDGFGFSVDGDSYESRRNRAQANAIKEMEKVLKDKSL